MPQAVRIEEYGLISMSAVLIGGAVISVLFSVWWGLVLMLVSPAIYLCNVGRLAWLRISRKETSSFASDLAMPTVFFWLAGLLFLSGIGQPYHFGLHVFQILTGLFLVFIFFVSWCYRYSSSL